MLNNEEIMAIEAVDLAPKVEQAITSLDKKHGELLFPEGSRTGERQVPEVVVEVVPRQDQLEADIDTVRGPRGLSADNAELVPWDVQFTE